MSIESAPITFHRKGNKQQKYLNVIKLKLWRNLVLATLGTYEYKRVATFLQELTEGD